MQHGEPDGLGMDQENMLAALKSQHTGIPDSDATSARVYDCKGRCQGSGNNWTYKQKGSAEVYVRPLPTCYGGLIHSEPSYGKDICL